MARIASFPSRSTLRSIAREAYRFALTHALYEQVRTIDGIKRTISVDLDLGAVFIDWIDPALEIEKSANVAIAKSWC